MYQASEILHNGVQLGAKGAWPRLRDLLLNIWNPLYIAGTAKARNVKPGVQRDYDKYYSKNAKLGDKRDPLNISGTVKVTNFQKLSMGMTGISGQSAEPPSRSSGRAHKGKGRGKEGLKGLQPETKHLHTSQSILLAILFKNVLKMLKIIQPVTFSLTCGDHLPHPA